MAFQELDGLVGDLAVIGLTAKTKIAIAVFCRSATQTMVSRAFAR
jgi:hypothetical protein